MASTAIMMVTSIMDPTAIVIAPTATILTMATQLSSSLSSWLPQLLLSCLQQLLLWLQELVVQQLAGLQQNS